jgi:hypothetical protein
MRYVNMISPRAARLLLASISLSLGACAADVGDADNESMPDELSYEEVAKTSDALANHTGPANGTACTVKDLGGVIHTGKSEKGGQWCCTPAGSAPDANTCYNCSQWSYTCTAKTGVLAARF